MFLKWFYQSLDGKLWGKGDSNTASGYVAEDRKNAQNQNQAGIDETRANANGLNNQARDAYSNFAATGGLGSWSGAMGGNGNPGAPSSNKTGGFSDKVNSLYAKYGKKDTGPGSGITDAGYWANDAYRNAGGDEDYVLGRLESDLQGKGPDEGGGGMPGGGGGDTSYLNTFKELQGSGGGFDQNRLSNLNDTIAKLKNQSGNYGATDKSIKGLQDFAATGGVSDANKNDIQNPVFREMAATGGYNQGDISNMRARSNASIGDTYRNLQDSMMRRQASSGNMSPGMSAAGFRLARQGAQDIGTNAQGTELGIKNAINTNRMAGAGALSNATLGLSGLQSQNTLQGYGSAGNLDEAKQRQLADALSASGGLDLNTQQLINNTRLAATSGLSQDALSRYGINSQQSIAQMMNDSANRRFMLGQEQQGKEFGASGLAGMNAGNQGLLYNYRGQLGNQMGNATGHQVGLAGQQSPWPSYLSAAGGLMGSGGNLLRYFGGPGGGDNSDSSGSDWGQWIGGGGNDTGGSVR